MLNLFLKILHYNFFKAVLFYYLKTMLQITVLIFQLKIARRDKQRMTNQISKSVTKCIRDAKSLPLASSISEQVSFVLNC